MFRPLSRSRQPDVPAVPRRITLNIEKNQLLDVVMHEYDATRAEIQSSLSNQVSMLSFGAATVGFLVAGAAQLWKDVVILASLPFLLAVPAMCFLTLAIYFAELIRIMRAALFLHELENSVNEAGRSMELANKGRLLTWEQWKVRSTMFGPDMERHGGLMIPLVFAMLGLGFMITGYSRLHDTPGIHELWTTSGLFIAIYLSVLPARYAWLCNRYAYQHRLMYSRPDRLRPED
jgi:hypothetical protein